MLWFDWDSYNHFFQDYIRYSTIFNKDWIFRFRAFMQIFGGTEALFDVIMEYIFFAFSGTASI